jgi:predicted AlkP superfamily phosphohydrolase/phosphomutase
VFSPKEKALNGNSPELLVVAFDGAVPSYLNEAIDRLPLPAFRELRERGVWFEDCRPAFPSITPTCWSSFATGATPARHGAVDQDYHPPGSTDPLSLVSCYHGDEILAERFWEAAARGGKRSLILQMPASGPRRSDRVMQISGTGCAAIGGAVRGKPTVPPAVEVPALLLRLGPDAKSEVGVATGELSPASGQWDPEEARKILTGVRSGGAEREPIVVPVDTTDSVSGVVPFSWYFRAADGKLSIFEGADGEAIASLAPGEWSPVLRRNLATRDGERTFRYQAKLLELAEDRLGLYIAPMGDLSRSVEPAEFAARTDAVDEVPAHTGNTPLLYGGDPDSYLEAEAFNLAWQRKVIEETLERDAPEIVVTYAVYLDSMNHRYRNDVEGISEASESDRAKAVAAYERSYRLADEHLGKLLALCDDHTDVIIVSDHGSVGYTSIFRPDECLEKAGLLSYEPGRGEKEPRKIDWTRTRAYSLGTCYVRVNLRGRETGGIVEPDEYEGVVNEAIAALKCATKGGISPVAFAVAADQAGFLGLGGERCGDVVFGITGSRVGGHVGGVHAVQIPSARSATGDIRSLLILSGPSFVRGVRLERQAYLWDIAPTICHARGYPQPADVEGAVLFEALAYR